MHAYSTSLIRDVFFLFHLHRLYNLTPIQRSCRETTTASLFVGKRSIPHICGAIQQDVSIFNISTFTLAIAVVIVRSGCLVDYILNELKPKHLGTLVKGFSWLYYLKWKTHPKSGSNPLVAAQIKGYEKGKPLVFVCLPSLWLVNSSILFLKHPFIGVITYIFRILTLEWKLVALQDFLGNSSNKLGLKTTSLMD